MSDDFVRQGMYASRSCGSLSAYADTYSFSVPTLDTIGLPKGLTVSRQTSLIKSS